jgi:hypothetical protein
MGKVLKVKKAGISPSGEERDRLHATIQTRADNQFALDGALDHSKTTREQERAKAKTLFVQAERAESMAPSLQVNLGEGLDKEASFQEISPPLAPTVDEWFEKNSDLFLSEAQREFPELLKVAAEPQKVPILRRRYNESATPGPVPSQHSISGGSA